MTRDITRGAVTRRGALALAGAAAALSACGTRSEPQTELSFTVESDSTINPNEDSEPSPVLVRVYELRNASEFHQATLFELLDDDRGRLGDDLIGRREIEVRPSDSTTFERESSGEARYIGVFAAFRDVDNATWRGTTRIEPSSENSIEILLTGTTVQIDSRRVRFGLF